MSTIPGNLPVLSADFFELFDQLDQKASSLEENTTALKEFKGQRDKAQRDLRELQKELRWTRLFIKEQKGRISLVSSHWFYGTVWLQPQLWLRGGCTGKIQRAQKKLTKSQNEDLPRLEAGMEHIQQVDLPKWQAEVDEQLERFQLSANAASEREVMRQRALQEYPSPKLLLLQQEETNLQQSIENGKKEGDNLDTVIAQLLQAQNNYKSAINLLQQAKKHNDKYEHLKKNPVPFPRMAEVLHQSGHRSRSETLVADGSRVVSIENTKGEKDLFHVDKYAHILSTNFPCPNPNCVYLVTWHDTHCCNACTNGSNHNSHGRRCERKPLHCQQGAQQKHDDRMKLEQAQQTSQTKENDASNRTFTQARKETKQAERTIGQAVSCIPISIRERYSNVCQGLFTNLHDVTPSSPPPGGCPCSAVRANNIQQELAGVTQRQAVVTQQLLGTVQQLMTQVRQDTHNMERQLHDQQTILECEESRIFQELRSSVMGSIVAAVPTALPTDYYEPVVPPPAFAPAKPSAPTEDEVLAQSMDRWLLPRS